MMILAGLGNPGAQYANTRHNAGFMLLDALQQAYAFPAWKKQHQALLSKGRIGAHEVILLKPQTFMNLSGASVQAAMTYYKVPLAQLWVAHDELDLALGKVRYKQGGGDAGHNGLRSISGAVGSNYHRLRLGIDRPPPPLAVEDYVLSSFQADEKARVQAMLTALSDSFPALLENPLDTLAKLGNLRA